MQAHMYDRQQAHSQVYQSSFATVFAQSISVPSSQELTGVVAYLGNYPITEESKCTEALVGASFCQSATLDYQGKKVLMFVFSVRALLLPRYCLSFCAFISFHFGDEFGRHFRWGRRYWSRIPFLPHLFRATPFCLLLNSAYVLTILVYSAGLSCSNRGHFYSSIPGIQHLRQGSRLSRYPRSRRMLWRGV